MELLDVSHLRPRNTLSANLYKNLDNVELMCKNCHNLWENGYIGVNLKGHITIHEDLLDYKAFHSLIGKYYSRYNEKNQPFILWHYIHIHLHP